MGGQGTIWAFDRDPKRLDRLQANADSAGATNIIAQQVSLTGSQLAFITYTCMMMIGAGELLTLHPVGHAVSLAHAACACRLTFCPWI